MRELTFRDALNEALDEELARDPDTFLMGEEVGAYNGAYKVSKGLLQEFGEMRVVDTPITELGFAGVGVGAAMVGLRPVIEFMTWNFAIPALDQILNAASKMLYMSGGQFPMPMVFRGPNGAALQLSAQHSQSFESWLAHMPGVKVVAPGTPYDAKGMMNAALAGVEKRQTPMWASQCDTPISTASAMSDHPSARRRRYCPSVICFRSSALRWDAWVSRARRLLAPPDRSDFAIRAPPRDGSGPRCYYATSLSRASVVTTPKRLQPLGHQE